MDNISNINSNQPLIDLIDQSSEDIDGSADWTLMQKPSEMADKILEAKKEIEFIKGNNIDFSLLDDGLAGEDFSSTDRGTMLAEKPVAISGANLFEIPNFAQDTMTDKFQVEE